jgi:FkbH-like protein
MPPRDNSLDLRRQIDSHMQAGSFAVAVARIRELWRSRNDLATAAFVCSRYEQLRGRLPLTPHRTAILRSFTIEPILTLLRANAFCAGIDLTLRVGDFNAYSQEILDPASPIYDFRPDSVILAVRTPDVAPELWNRYPHLSPGEVQAACHRVSTAFQRYIAAFREHSQTSFIVHNLEQPVRPSRGILDAQTVGSQAEALREINRELIRQAVAHTGVYVLDYDALVARHGRLRWSDERKYLTTGLPISSENLIHLSREWLRLLVPLSGRIAKVLVTDLDNTLWGGVVGEDGIAGIQIGPEYPGAAFQSLQRSLLNLSRRGILLAICSKNNPEDALEVIDKHPGMLLRREHFAALRIGWNDKVQSLREIASELNLGTDSLAFLDDNPVEREEVGASLPEVMVIDVPADPFAYASAVLDYPAFERLSLSEEDQQRTAIYAQQRERSQGEQQFQSKEDFYRFLDQKVEFAALSRENLSRIAQLTQKTNQFNLTTRRYSEQQISEIGAREGWQVFSLRVQDRYGDQGLVGVAITHDEQDACEIDTFLLSCRVIGRTVETAFLAALATAAQQRGRLGLAGYFLPTRKNAPVRTFYSQHGFELEGENGEGSRWVLNLADRMISCPDWIELKVIEGATI